MKVSTKLFMSSILLAGLATGANAQSTATATTTATLITPISVAKEADMNFGQIASSGTAGTVVLGYANDASVSDGVSSPDGGATATTASFIVTGASTNGFSVTIPTSIQLTDGGANTLTVSDFTADLGAASALVDGTKTIKVGATLNVPANTLAGTYTNTSTDVATGLFVTVDYN
jgi:hypothetical protein